MERMGLLSKPNKSSSSKEIVQLAYRPILPHIIYLSVLYIKQVWIIFTFFKTIVSFEKRQRKKEKTRRSFLKNKRVCKKIIVSLMKEGSFKFVVIYNGC